MPRIFGFEMQKDDIALVGQDRHGNPVTDITSKFNKHEMVNAWRAAGMEIHGVVRRKIN